MLTPQATTSMPDLKGVSRSLAGFLYNPGAPTWRVLTNIKASGIKDIKKPLIYNLLVSLSFIGMTLRPRKSVKRAVACLPPLRPL